MRLLRLVIECITPLHCGAGADDILDSPVSRDAFGYWRIPGSSLAGSLRAIADNQNPALASRLFGDQDGSDSHASLVWCEDGLLLDYDGSSCLEHILSGSEPQIRPGPFVRDHVHIDCATGASVEGGKFDAEIVPAGARFLLEFRCDGWDRPLSQEETAAFDALASQVLAGNLSLGGRDALGYGQYRVVESAYRDLDLAKPEGMEAWLALPVFGLPPAEAGKEISVAQAAPSQGSGLSGNIELPLVCPGPILIGGGLLARPQGTGLDADILFALTPRINYGSEAHEIWEPVLPASSIRGVFRHAVYNILTDLGIEKRDEILNRMFGFVEGDSAQCGKLALSDSPLEFAGKRPNFQFEQHVAIDRFSGSALDGALFSEEPVWSENTGALVRICVNNLEAHEAALFFHALFDLLEGSLALGSGVNRGNGRLCLPGWTKDPKKAAAKIAGDLAWNGAGILEDNLETLEKLLPEWDSALKALL